MDSSRKEKFVIVKEISKLYTKPHIMKMGVGDGGGIIAPKHPILDMSLIFFEKWHKENPICH